MNTYAFLALVLLLGAGCANQDPVLHAAPDPTPTPHPENSPTNPGTDCRSFTIPTLTDGLPSTQRTCSRLLTESLVTWDLVEAGDPATATVRIMADPSGDVELTGLTLSVRLTNGTNGSLGGHMVLNADADGWFGMALPSLEGATEIQYRWTTDPEQVAQEADGWFQGVAPTSGLYIERGQSITLDAEWFGTHLMTAASEVEVVLRELEWVDVRSGEHIHEPLIEPLPGLLAHIGRTQEASPMHGVSIFENEDAETVFYQNGWSNILPLFYVVSHGQDRILQTLSLRVDDPDQVINLPYIGYTDRFGVVTSHVAYPDQDGLAVLGDGSPYGSENMEVLLPADTWVPIWAGASFLPESVGSQVRFTLDACTAPLVVQNLALEQDVTEHQVQQFVRSRALTVLP